MVDLFFLKPCWLSESSLFASMKPVIWLHTMFSSTFKSAAWQLTGLKLNFILQPPFSGWGSQLQVLPLFIELFLSLPKFRSCSLGALNLTKNTPNVLRRAVFGGSTTFGFLQAASKQPLKLTLLILNLFTGAHSSSASFILSVNEG